MKPTLTLSSLILLAVGATAQNPTQAITQTTGATLGAHLTPADPALQRLKQHMIAQHWTGLRLFPAQSFPLLIDGSPAGVLISGDAHAHKDESDACFLAFVEPGKAPAVLPTVENLQPASDIPACGSVRAFGLLASPTPALVRIGVIYYINAPIAGDAHGAISENEAVVLAFDRRTHQLTIDQPATDKASATDPENLPALAAALSR